MPPPNVSLLLAAGVPRFNHEGSVESLAFSPDGAKLVACDVRWTTMWNPGSGEALWRAAPGGVAEFVDDESVLVSGYTNQPCVFNAATGEMLAALPWYGSHAVIVPEDGGDAAFAGHAILEGEQAAGLVVISLPGDPLAAEGTAGDREAVGMGSMVMATLAASPDGKTLVASERSRPRKITRAVASRTLEKRWQIEEAGRVAFSPDGARLAMQTERGELVFLDPATGREIARAPQQGIVTFAFSADGSRIALGTTRAIEIVDAKSFGKVMTLEPAGIAKDARVTAVAFSPDGKRLAAGLPDRLTLFELDTRRELGASAGHTRGVWAMALPGDGVVVTRGATDTKRWQIASGELISTDARPEEIWPIPALAVAPKGVLVDAEPDALRLKNARGETAGSLEGLRPLVGAASQILVAPQVSRLVAIFAPETEDASSAVLRIFDLENWREVAAPPLPGEIRADSPIAFSPSGASLAIPVRNEEDYTERAVVIAFDGRRIGESPGGQSIVGLAFLDTKRLLVVRPGSMQIVDTSGRIETDMLRITDASPREFDENEDADSDAGFSATAVAVSPDGSLVAFGNAYAGTVRVCPNGRWNEATLCGTRLGVKVLCFSADSKTLGAGLEDGSFRVWSLT